jgi:transketolase
MVGFSMTSHGVIKPENYRLNLQNIRKRILEVAHKTRSPHVGSALSCVEIAFAAYQQKLKHHPSDYWKTQVVFSKGHAALALYATLEELELIDPKSLDSYNGDSSQFYGHVSSSASSHIELTTGSLGHGLPFALGIALAKRLSGNLDVKTIVIMSDGECNEGTTWESALIANHYQLKDFYVVVDRNRLQSLGDTEATLALEPFAHKWQSFGWEVYEINGHDLESLCNLLDGATKPRCIIANTHKGNGVSFMTDQVLWHYRSPNADELRDALCEIGYRDEK